MSSLTLPGLLVSVRNAAEAQLAFATGVDVIDIKEPSNGSLGMPSQATITSILRVVPDEQVLSLAIGELCQLDEAIAQGIVQLIVESKRIRFLKIGLSNMLDVPDWKTRWAYALKQLSGSTIPVAVVYADQTSAQSPTAMEIIQTGNRLNCGAVLIDTFDKSIGNLFSHLSVHELTKLRMTAHQLGMRFVLAGSLNESALDSALRTGADYIGVRGAVCRSGEREESLCQLAIKDLSRSLKQIGEISISN